MFDSPQQLDFVKYVLLQGSSDGFDRNVLVPFSSRHIVEVREGYSSILWTLGQVDHPENTLT